MGEALPETYGEVGPGRDKGRRFGVLLHPTSLPGKYGAGDLGDEARAFVDWLSDTGARVWQVSSPPPSRSRRGPRCLPGRAG